MDMVAIPCLEYMIFSICPADGARNVAMRLEVDPLQCGCTGYCVKLAPVLFGWLPQGGAARARKAPESDDERRLAREAADLCPTRAIVLRETAAGDGDD